ncbi:hypothetical protein BCR41DRAFT_426105 [Lobosporangium transversale]|uniref:Uncharacterized protein n=1 Tax=Lobosporangium transversale TaxID=64571 RepID=A0A1Y2G8C3_9FUNG|nr:hypothetical protein BCR41DRAFT_426105 [Lobosporangium transversale]ORZ04081.1 hypothetical protein BCR41DRAFT_426105 [Lobosporangium transversale]|eukprot:XP_021876358.1 hypothetical protein BCR41DRAFT_426105 [Lobosporangium transversale]
MCSTIEFVAFDALIVVGVILLIVWILALCGIFTIGTGPLEHLFIVLAIIFIIAWLFTRFYYGGRRWGYGRRTIV